MEVSGEVPPVHAHALAILAETLLSREQPAEALAPAAEAVRVLESLGGIEEGEALVRLVHAEALAATGKVDEARAGIARARDRLLERAARISDPKMRTSFLHNVAENVRTVARAKEWAG